MGQIIDAKKLMNGVFSFKKLTTIQESQEILLGVCYWLYGLSLSVVLLGVFTKQYNMIFVDAVFLILCGSFLVKYHSRTFALLLCLLTVLECYVDLIILFAGKYTLFGVDFVNKLNMATEIISIIWVINLFILFLALKAFQAAAFYHKSIGSKVKYWNVLIKTGLSILYTFLAYLIFIIIPVAGMGEDSFLKINHFALGFVVLYVTAIVVWLSFKGVLPFTKNRPVCIHK